MGCPNGDPPASALPPEDERPVSISTRLFRLHRRMISDDPAVVPMLARELLWPPAAIYWLVARLRNALYDRGVWHPRRAAVPVISVGNITAGGTGKTPIVAWLARLLSRRGMHPAILSRGYGADRATGIDDENRLLAAMAGGAPVVVDPDRLRGAAHAVRVHGADVLILDDGFQHRRIARDLDIVLIDALRPFGADWMLPRGLLREPLAGLNRTDFVIVTRADLVDAARLENTRESLPRVPVACCEWKIAGMRRLGSDEVQPPETIRRGRWSAFCGVGNPEGFRATLEQARCRLGAFAFFADHHAYTARDVEDMLVEARVAGCDGVLTTEKDAVKIEPLLKAAPSPPIFALRTELEFTDGCAALTAAILRAVGKEP